MRITGGAAAALIALPACTMPARAEDERETAYLDAARSAGQVPRGARSQADLSPASERVEALHRAAARRARLPLHAMLALSQAAWVGLLIAGWRA